MANPIVNFITVIDAVSEQIKLVLTDVTDYTDVPTVLPRTWIIIHADGRKEVIPAPQKDYTYLVSKDEALAVRLVLNYNPADERLGFSTLKNVLVSPYITDKLYQLRRKMLDLFVARTAPRSVNLRDNIAWISGLEEAALSTISTDLVKCQEALDLANQYADQIKCDL